MFFFPTAYQSPEWGLKRTNECIDICSVQHKTSSITAVWSDSMTVLGKLAVDIVEKRPSCLVIRVLRATANESYRESIRELARQEHPQNMFTLWVREEIKLLLGGFKALNKDMPLEEQLLDISRDGAMHAMQRTVQKKKNSRKNKNKGDRVGNVHEEKFKCSICQVIKSAPGFSKTQREKVKGNRRHKMKCSGCVGQNL